MQNGSRRPPGPPSRRTRHDNTTVTLNAAQMIAAGVAVGIHVATCHAIGAGLREAIIAATSVEDLDDARADRDVLLASAAGAVGDGSEDAGVVCADGHFGSGGGRSVRGPLPGAPIRRQ